MRRLGERGVRERKAKPSGQERGRGSSRENPSLSWMSLVHGGSESLREIDSTCIG
jgi:hypothetical protein